MANNSITVPVKVEDYLDEDPALRGQNYVCLSFISPEDILKKKDTYFFELFLQEFSKDMNEFFTNMGEKYPDDSDSFRTIKERYQCVFNTDSIVEEYQYFVNSKSAELEKLYFEKNNFQTSIRGIKVRGTFDTLREAEIRAQVLKRLDDKFHVYVAQVGCWCPWSPNPDDIQDQEYAETQLNTLMKNYKENQVKKDIFYEERKKELQILKIKEKLEEKDTWVQKTEENVIVEEVIDVPEDVSVKTTPVDVPVSIDNEVSTETPVSIDNEVSTEAEYISIDIPNDQDKIEEKEIEQEIETMVSMALETSVLEEQKSFETSRSIYCEEMKTIFHQ